MKEFKVGDKVWVLCEVVAEPDGKGVHVVHWGAGWYADLSACKPVEQDEKPEANAVFISPGHDRIGTHGTAKHHSGNMFYFESLGGQFMIWCDRSDFEWLDPATHVPVEQTETVGPERICVGDTVEIKCNSVWNGTKGVATQWCPNRQAFWIEAINPARKCISGWMKEEWNSSEEYGACRLVKVGVEPSRQSTLNVKSSPIKEVNLDLSYHRRLAWNDILQKRDIIFYSKTLDFHEAYITIGMKVEDLFSSVRDTFGGTLTFYRPIK
jgi:hypothetical protein